MADNRSDYTAENKRGGYEKLKRPLVSVVIPAYNCENTLETAIASAAAQQVPLELLIVDDASTDGTRDVIEDCSSRWSSEEIFFRIFYQKENRGVAACRNLGVSMASTEYVAFLDSDDWWAEGKLKKQLARLKETGAVLCSTGREFAAYDGTLTGHVVGVRPFITYRNLLYDNTINCSSVLLKTEVAREFPMGHDECHEDYITWLQVLKAYGPACGINEPLLKYRRSLHAKTENKWKSAKMHYHSLRLTGIGRLRALWYFCFYALNGVWKYFIK